MNQIYPAGSEQPRFIQVEFRGDGREFFGIWIVNLFLSIVTLGVYSAWAKVRTNRYFYGHTLVHGEPLRYLANPVQILIGRIIGVALLGTYLLLSYASPGLSLIMLAILLLLMPLLVYLSLRFQMRMTAWRNVRFQFSSDYGEAFVHFLVYPILGVLSLYLAFPWVLKKIDQYIYRNASYGDRRFQCEPDTGTYYAAVLAAIGVSIVAIIALVIASTVLTIMLGAAVLPTLEEGAGASDSTMPIVFSPFFVGIVIGYLVVIIAAGAIYQAIVRNHLFSRTALPGLALFRSEVSVIGLTWLLFTNLLLIAFTLGLAYPWVKVRTARFFALATGVHVSPEIDEVIAGMPEETSAIGEEVAGVFDFEVGFV